MGYGIFKQEIWGYRTQKLAIQNTGQNQWDTGYLGL